MKTVLAFFFLALCGVALAQSIDTIGGTVAPSGAAGGCLAGTYPNPSLASACTITSPALAGTVTGNNTIPLAILAQGATNTLVGNVTSGTANFTAVAVGSCSTSSSALIWTTNTGPGCNTSINATTLGGATFAAPGQIGGTPQSEVDATGLISKGTKFTTSGCSVSSTTGGAAAGTFTVGANNCTVVVTINGATGLSAPNGWACGADDTSALTILISQSSSTTATASFNIPITAGSTDVVKFFCMGY